MIRTAITALASAAFLIACGGGESAGSHRLTASPDLCPAHPAATSPGGYYTGETEMTLQCVFGEVLVYDHVLSTWSVHSSNALHVATWRAFEYEGLAYLVGSGDCIGPADESHTYAVCSRDNGINWTAGEC